MTHREKSLQHFVDAEILVREAAGIVGVCLGAAQSDARRTAAQGGDET